MAKTVPLSVRVSHEDAEFIANLYIGDALTPSDKVRAIIREARKQKERKDSYEGYLATAQDSLGALLQKVKSLELDEHQHSELVAIFGDWVADAYAFVAAAQHSGDGEILDLKHLEEGIADRVFRLLETVARMGVTKKAPCYDPDIVSKKFIQLMELTQIINQRIAKEN